MNAGRELDALVAERVMGLAVNAEGLVGSPAEHSRDGVVTGHGTLWRLPPFYSTDIAAAWTVVEKLGERGFHARILSPFQSGATYHAGFTPHGVTAWNGRPDFEAGSYTAPHAICLAALAAVGAEVSA